jgi:hypothetical protein
MAASIEVDAFNNLPKRSLAQILNDFVAVSIRRLYHRILAEKKLSIRSEVLPRPILLNVVQNLVSRLFVI